MPNSPPISLSLSPSLPPDDHVIVGYSGGKDSLAVLDLCHRAGKQITCYHLTPLPGLAFTAYLLRYIHDRFSPSYHTHIYPSPTVFEMLAKGFMGSRPRPYFPRIKRSTYLSVTRYRSKALWVGLGLKSCDSMHRRGELASWENGLDWHAALFSPVKNWHHRDVYAYLNSRRIEAPADIINRYRLPTDRSGMSGNIFDHPTLRMLSDLFPGDLDILFSYYPHARSMVDNALKGIK